MVVTTPQLNPNLSLPDPPPADQDAVAPTEAAAPQPGGGFAFVIVDGGDAEVCGPDGVCA